MIKSLSSIDIINTLQYIEEVCCHLSKNQRVMTQSCKMNHSSRFYNASHAHTSNNLIDELRIDELRKIIKATLPTKGQGDKENNRISPRFILRFKERVCKGKCSSLRCKFMIDHPNHCCILDHLYEFELLKQNEECGQIFTSLEKNRFEKAIQYMENYFKIMMMKETN